VNRRRFLSALGLYAGAATTTTATALTPAQSIPANPRPAQPTAALKIQSVDILELHGHYTAESGVDHQAQVNPEDIYDDLRPPIYSDKPGGTAEVKTEAIYLRIRTAAGIDGLYGPIERDAARVVYDDLRPFLIGKDALAGEALWDQMYRSSRHSRDGFFMMAISAVDNTLWDIRGKFFGVPVWRLLGGPTRQQVEFYASALGSALHLDAVMKRCLQLRDMGFRYQKWFMGYGPGSGEEGMRKNVELVKTLRETLGEDYELMFDMYSGWDQNYALEWAKRVEQYRPKWMEEITHPEKIESFAEIHRMTSIPIAAGEHFYGRWEVERYLQANALSVVQADPEWCGGISELLKIGTVASLHDIPVLPHGHSLRAAAHTIFSQSPMTFPLGEYLVLKMQPYHHFEKNPPVVENAHMTLPTNPGFDVVLDEGKVESLKVWNEQW
jgi:L-alanine-DL-glutamate epimerase-like enolase superfamily enzyme